MNGLKTRLKYSETDRDNTVKKIAGLQKQLDKMREDLEKFNPTIRFTIYFNSSSSLAKCGLFL